MSRFYLFIGCAGTIFGVWLLWPQPEDVSTEIDTPALSGADARLASYVTSNECRRCHEREYSTWHGTWHRTMTQEPSSDSVIGDFDNVRLSAYGRDYHLQHTDDQYLVTMVAPEWETGLILNGQDPTQIREPPVVTRPVVKTTGSHRMQTYWVQADDGLRQVPWFFHIEEQMWIPAEDSFLSAPSSNRIFSIWNMQCLKCHSTGAQPRLNQFNGHFYSKVPELGISCEACHGPGKDHVAFHTRKTRPPTTDASDPIFNPKKADHVLSSQACGQCHSSSNWHDMDDWLHSGSKYDPGSDFTKHAGYELPDQTSSNRPEDYAAQAYWQDGTCRVGGDEFMGMMNSSCYKAGTLNCTSCHSMHDSDPDKQLARGMRSNEACTQCHVDYQDKLQQHTHHSPESAGSLCYNCHMPYTSYALLQALRSHRIDSPSATVSVRTGRPNACNLCHLDRTLAWTSSTLHDWYGQEVVTLDDEEQRLPASVLWLLKGDAMQRVIAAWALGWEPAMEASGKDWEVPFIASTLTDPYAAIRFVAWRSLKQYPEFGGLEFSITADVAARTRQRDSALSRIEPETVQTHVAPLFPGIDHAELLQWIEDMQSQRDDRAVHIPE